MCWRSASDYDLNARANPTPMRTDSKPERSLLEVLRDLFRPRRSRVQEAEVVPLPVAACPDKDHERKSSKAA